MTLHREANRSAAADQASKKKLEARNKFRRNAFQNAGNFKNPTRAAEISSKPQGSSLSVEANADIDHQVTTTRKCNENVRRSAASAHSKVVDLLKYTAVAF